MSEMPFVRLSREKLDQGWPDPHTDAILDEHTKKTTDRKKQKAHDDAAPQYRTDKANKNLWAVTNLAKKFTTLENVDKISRPVKGPYASRFLEEIVWKEAVVVA